MKQVPQRTCIGCLTKQPKEKLMRLIVKKGQVVSDPTGRVSSRGAYLCKTGKGIKKSCFKKARERNAFKRAFRKQVKYAQEKSKDYHKKRKTPTPTSGSGNLRPC